MHLYMCRETFGSGQIRDSFFFVSGLNTHTHIFIFRRRIQKKELKCEFICGITIMVCLITLGSLV